MIKPIALYLPQFHETNENNEWWGKGFTEWEHLKNFKPLFTGHTILKPHSDIGYYDLTDVKVRRKQAELAKKFGIYGFCYYHYWSNGKMLLNKPTEMMLQDGEPDLPFMFSWANHDWTRKWQGNDKDILWLQEYGGVEDWENHFNYLLKFFRHPNYIKIENAPCFVIYVPLLIPELEKLIDYFNKRSIEEGFSGIYFIGTELSFGNKYNRFYQAKYFDSYFTHEPSHVIYNKNIEFKLRNNDNDNYNSVDCSALYKEIEFFSSPLKEPVLYRGTCTGFDNSARIKKELYTTKHCTIIENNSPELFESHLKKMFLAIQDTPTEDQLFFITAWNEWGEGSVLEPSDKYGYKYLQAVKNSLQYDNEINPKKILIIATEMISISGSPMYNYTLAAEFKAQGHDVDIYSQFSDNEIKKRLIEIGVIPITTIDGGKLYDLTLISQPNLKKTLNVVKSNNIINIIHSEYDCESPIIDNRITNYIAIRPKINDHLIKEHGINKDKIHIIYNGVDFERFNPSKRKKHEGDYTKVILPCTIDNLRMPFLKYYTNKANKNFRVYIYGQSSIPDFKEIFKNEWVFINNADFDIENHISDADIVAGILLGRINIEAMAMGIPSFIHHPEEPEYFYRFDLDKNEFEQRHNIKNVARSILRLCKNKPVITVNHPSPIINEQVKQIFTKYYEINHWRDPESASGTGSNLMQTQTLIDELPGLFKRFDIKTLLDIPCGDFFWMQHVNLSGIKYMGADIVDALIKRCNESYPFDFNLLDIINSDLPKVDLIFCRDCFVHLPYSEIKKALQNIKKSGSKYLLTTSFPKHNNTDISMGNWRPIDLQKPPFDLGKPIFTLNENCTEDGGIYNDKSVCLWKL